MALIRRRTVLPGFGLTFGITLTYLSLIVLLPLSALLVKASDMGWSGLLATVTEPRVVASLELSFLAALAAALINLVLGLALAWTLVRYRFPGRRLLDAAIDLPFALPTAVSGLALTAILAPTGWIGTYLEEIGVRAAFTRTGVVIALVFIGLPFMVRTAQPAIADLDRETEEAAASLGAGRWQTFRRVLLPALVPACVTGFTLAFARALGEYGSVVFISGNMPGKTEIASVLIIGKLEQYDYAGAAGIATVMLAVSLAMLITINLLQRWAGVRQREAGA
ncbi:MAG TPA: sulfate ABC transporter permease subunit CysT [Kofleriaceae bacterium]|nr:sulfate ABC transporter permease subunit CysT [Kofleriaceae bacterium]